MSFPCKRDSSVSRNVSDGVEWFDLPLAVFSVKKRIFDVSPKAIDLSLPLIVLGHIMVIVIDGAKW